MTASSKQEALDELYVRMKMKFGSKHTKLIKSCIKPLLQSQKITIADVAAVELQIEKEITILSHENNRFETPVKISIQPGKLFDSSIQNKSYRTKRRILDSAHLKTAQSSERLQVTKTPFRMIPKSTDAWGHVQNVESQIIKSELAHQSKEKMQLNKQYQKDLQDQINSKQSVNKSMIAIRNKEIKQLQKRQKSYNDLMESERKLQLRKKLQNKEANQTSFNIRSQTLQRLAQEQDQCDKAFVAKVVLREKLEDRQNAKRARDTQQLLNKVRAHQAAANQSKSIAQFQSQREPSSGELAKVMEDTNGKQYRRRLQTSLNRIHNDNYLGSLYPHPLKAFQTAEEESQEAKTRRYNQQTLPPKIPQSQDSKTWHRKGKHLHAKSFDQRKTGTLRSKQILNDRIYGQEL